MKANERLILHEIYKLLDSDDIEEEKEYSYWVCVGFKDNYSILNELEQWCGMNGQRDTLDMVEDLDEEFVDNPELELKHFKRLNSLEALYYQDEEVNHEKPIEKKRKFTIV